MASDDILAINQHALLLSELPVLFLHEAPSFCLEKPLPTDCQWWESAIEQESPLPLTPCNVASF